MEKYKITAVRYVPNPNPVKKITYRDILGREETHFEDEYIREEKVIFVMADHHIQYDPYHDNLCGTSDAGRAKLFKLREEGYELYTSYPSVGTTPKLEVF